MRMSNERWFFDLQIFIFTFGIVFLVFSSEASCNGYAKYDVSGSVSEGKLNVHLVPHSHDDVGWLKTVDQYYVGSNNSIQGACVENVLDSVVESLSRNQNRRFIFIEQAFFQRWWASQSEGKQDLVKELVKMGQLEFINGGWVMHDEATTHYIDMIDQTTLGHHLLKQQFSVVPRAGWQIDPFGHSSVQAYLLGYELGFDSVHFARIDYQDREQRKKDRSLEVIWRGSRTFGSTSEIFANAFPVHYDPPHGFSFEVNDNNSIPIQDDIFLYDYNVKQRVEDFVTAAIIQSNLTRTNHIMWTMGNDFQYQYAESWFKHMDKLIHYVNKDGRVNALYSTPTIYTDAKHAERSTWPLKIDDYFPYADKKNAYWTGYFSSRTLFKRYVRVLSGYYLAARQLEFLAGWSSDVNTFNLGDALGIAQHHDAVSGTAKQHTTNDYAKRLAAGASEAEAVINSALSHLMHPNSLLQTKTHSKLTQCHLLNISFCPATEKKISERKSLVVVAYNPLGWRRREVIRVPVPNYKLVVHDSAGNAIQTQYVEIDDVTLKIRNLYTQAYVDVRTKHNPKYWLLFEISLSPLGWNTYFISKSTQARNRTELWNKGCKYIPAMDKLTRGYLEIGPGNLKMLFSPSSGLFDRVINSKAGVDMPMKQRYLWYRSSNGSSDKQPSGAYIFRPNGSFPAHLNSVPPKVYRGPIVDEVHQQVNSWIYQVTRLYKNREHAEVEFTIGPIPIEDGVGKEIVTQFSTNMVTDKVFYTDSNGRDFIKRVRDYRADWPLAVHQPVAGNYYPLNLGIFNKDKNHEFSILVDRALGGSSLTDGELELMLHRRILLDDGRGVNEALNETVCVENKCEGLVVRGNVYLNVNKIGEGALWRRTTGQEVYSPIILAFTHEKISDWKASHLTSSTVMHPNYTLPPNVALITLQELEDGTVLLRLAHLFEANEDVRISVLAKVELKKIFFGKTIKGVSERSLSTNQDRSEMRRLKWKVEKSGQEEPLPLRGGPVDHSALVVELGPMEIRTFLLNF